MTGTKSERIRRLRLGELHRLFRDRCRGPILPDDDAGRDYLRELLLPISIGPYEAIRRPGAIKLWSPTDRMFREIELWAPWMQKDEARALVDEINQMPMWQRKPKARIIGERLNVPYGERERLGLRTIAPCDVSDDAMELPRKRKRRQRDRLRRQLRGQQSRADYLAKHKTSTKQPWLSMGISRRTYYYRLKQTNCTSPHQVNLKQSSQQPVQSTKHQVSKKEVAEQELSTIKSVGTPQAHKPEMSVTDTDKLLMTLTCAMREQTRSRVTVLPPGVKPDAVPTWAAMLQPDMAAIAAVAWFYGSLPRVGLAA